MCKYFQVELYIRNSYTYFMRGQPVCNKGMSHAGKGAFNRSDQEDEITKTTKKHVNPKCDNRHIYLSVPFVPGDY